MPNSLETPVPGFSVECNEPGGKVTRNIQFCPLSMGKLQYFYHKLKNFDVLFGDEVRGDPDLFTQLFIRIDAARNVNPVGLIWEVDDVGLLYLTDIIPGHMARAHFTFWDKIFEGRIPIIREGVRYAFEELGFARIYSEIPLYAKKTLNFIESVGFKREGRLRKIVKYHGEFWDANVYSVLRDEVTKWETSSSRP